MDNQFTGGQNWEPVKTGDWFLTMLITAIPLVGLIMLFVWAFGSGTNPNKANWAKASLIWYLVAVVIAIIFIVVFGALLFSGLSSSSFES
jgi:hypothetical protein